MELSQLPSHTLQNLVKEGKTSYKEITLSVFARIKKVEEKVKAYITLLEEESLKKAEEADKIFREKYKNNLEELPPLFGIPVALKDNLCTSGILTTCGSKILENFYPPYDATVVEKLKQQGCIIIGKTNMDEFAMGSSTENSAFFVTKNPWSLDRVPGGSSGGSAAGVSADETIVALGSDTGGSIRQPASFCGVVGLKPTYGRVSRYGLVAFASSLDQIGPITKDVRDCAILLKIISGYDKRDSTSYNIPVPSYEEFLKEDVKGLKIGIPKEFFAEGIEEEVKKIIYEAIDVLKNLGAECEETSLPHIEYSLACYYIIAPSEASSNLARYDGIHYGFRSKNAEELLDVYKKTRKEGFGKEVKRRIMLGTYALSAGYYDAYYLKAQKVRTLIRRDFEKVFEKYDVLITPTSPTPAFKIGEKIEDPLKMYLSDICTIPVNLAGLPAISIPAGFADGLPVGVQIIGKPYDEGTILKVAYTFEKNTEHHRKKPEI